MFRLKISLITLAVTFAHWTAYAPSADAGILRDWLNRRRARICQRNCCTTPAVGVAANDFGLQPGQCMQTCQQTCSRVVVNYVPCTSYRTTYERVPVTQYRPQTTSDPCTGCTVTCMRPCTTYTYQTRRVPYTTYRPVYRTETYRVPVTTITNDCTTCGTAPTCDTCSTGFGSFGSQTISSQPAISGQIVPGGTITTEGTFGTVPGTTVTPLPTPADISPTINPQDSNRSVIDSMGGSSTRVPLPNDSRQNWSLTSSKPASNAAWSDAPIASVAGGNDPVTRKWNYSPVKQASYVSLDDSAADTESAVTIVRGKFSLPAAAKRTEATSENRLQNSGWQTVQW